MEQNRIFPKVFMWMFIGLLLTFATGAIVSANENMLYNIFSKNLYIALIIIQFIVVIVLSAGIRKLSETTATILFLLYSVLTGLTFSSIFVVFEIQTIIMVFGVTAFLFALFALIGYFTKIDLTKFGVFLLMGLIGIIIVSIINMFLGNEQLDYIISIVGVIIFVGYTAYDMQKIKLIATEFENEQKVAIIGALELYLDFINLFLYLLRLFARNKD